MQEEAEGSAEMPHTAQGPDPRGLPVLEGGAHLLPTGVGTSLGSRGVMHPLYS